MVERLELPRLFASVNGEVFGIYVSGGDRNVRWSLLIGWFLLRTYLDSGLMAMCFWQLFFFSLFFCSIGFQMAGNLNDTIDVVFIFF